MVLLARDVLRLRKIQSFVSFLVGWLGGTPSIHPEEGNYNACRNVGQPSTFDAAYSQKETIPPNSRGEILRTKMENKTLCTRN
jgi:hypothetical protein